MSERLRNWEQKMDTALQEAQAQENLLLLADAYDTRAVVRTAHLTSLQLLAARSDMPAEQIPLAVLSTAIDDAQAALRIYTSLGRLEGELRAKMQLADLYDLAGQRAEARSLAGEVLPQAQAMDYPHLVARAEQHLSGQSLFSHYEADLRQMNTEDFDFRLAAYDADAIHLHAIASLRVLDIPEDRLPMVERECLSLQDIARERLHWCRHIQLLQNLDQTENPTTRYRIDPDRHCQCDLHGYESAIGIPNWQTVISAFKQTYCNNCSDRSPKSPQGQA
jgi:hypothetical protein